MQRVTHLAHTGHRKEITVSCILLFMDSCQYVLYALVQRVTMVTAPGPGLGIAYYRLCHATESDESCFDRALGVHHCIL